MAINDTDMLLINDGSQTETITISQVKDRNVLNDSDKFLVNDGVSTQTVTWAQLEEELRPRGIITKPTVLAPDDGTGSNVLIYLKSDKITSVEGGGVFTCETDTIQNVDNTTDAPNVILSFPSSNGFDCFETDDVVQGTAGEADEVKIIDIQPDANPPTITVDGGKWKGSDGTGDQSDGDTKLEKSTPYNHTLTVEGDTDLETMAEVMGGCLMTDGTTTPDGSGGNRYVQSDYKLTTTDIETVYDPGIVNSLQFDFTEVLRESNVTAITGFGASDTGASYTVEVSSVTVDGAQLNSTNVVTTGGAPFIPGSGTTSYDYQNFFTNALNANIRVQGEGADTDYTCTFNPVAVTNQTFVINVQAEPDAGTCWIYDQNGNKVTIWGNDPSLTLTFEGDLSANPDLQYFREGDLVQQDVFTNSYAENFFIATANADPTNVPTKTSTLVTNGASAFDGQTTTNALNVPSPGDGLWLDFPVPFKASSVGLWSTTGGSHDMKAVIYDDLGNEVAETFPSGGQQFRDVDTSSLPGNITSVVWWMPTNKITAWAYRVTVDGTTRYLIEGTPDPITVVTTGVLDGTNTNTMKVTGGSWISGSTNWNQTQTWTEAPIFNDNGIAPYSGREAANAFDGTIGMSAADGAMPNSGTWNWTFTGFDDAETVEIFGSSRTAGGQNQLNGVAFDEVTYANPVTIDVTGTGLQSLQISGNHGSNYHMVLTGIKVDGRLLVNPEYAAPANKVEYQTDGGVGELVSIDVAAKQLKIADTTGTTRDNRWIANNKADTAFSVAGPSKLDAPLLTSDVYLQSSEFATTPEDADGLKSIIWKIKNNTTGADDYEANAGTLNPWNPSNPSLEPNSNYTVQVKHRGNTLGDSEYSDAVSFSTGASRNLREHYEVQIAELLTRIEDLEGGG